MTARRLLTATTIGDGVAWVCQSGHGAGLVVGTFSSGFYVGAAGTVFAVGGRRIAAGPIHLVLDAPPPPPPVPSIVRLGPNLLSTDSCIIDLSRAAAHRPAQPTPARLRVIAPTLARLDRRDAAPHDLTAVWAAVRVAVERSDLHGARRLLEGLGGGLTPTGDDVLAGFLLFACWADPSSDLPAEVARHAATTDLSRCFLAWAAAGQSIQPIHELLDAAGEPGDRFDRAVAAVASIGGSSGKAMLTGLGLAAVAWSIPSTGTVLVRDASISGLTRPDPKA